MGSCPFGLSYVLFVFYIVILVISHFVFHIVILVISHFVFHIVILVISHFGFEDRPLVPIASVPGHCLYFNS